MAMLAIGGGTALAAAMGGTAATRTDRARLRLFWAGSLAAGIWLVSAWLTLDAGSGDAAVLGAWVLAIPACAGYGLVPCLLARRARPSR